nr:MAG TPA: hypothetical protein [Caudoviricetes sp.]
MRRKLILLILSTVLMVAMALPALACTPPLRPPKTLDMQSAYDTAYEAGKKAVENVVIPDSYFKSETESETETETETVIETETESEQVNEYYFRWEKYIPESLKNRWASFLRR